MSNNHSLNQRNLSWPLALISNILIALGFFFMANWIGGVFMYLSLGRMPVEADFVSTGQAALQFRNAELMGQLGGAIGGLIVLPLLYVFFLKKELIQPIFKPSFDQFPSFLLAAVSVTIIILPFVGIVGDWNKEISFPDSWHDLETTLRMLEERAAQATKLIVYYDSPGDMLLVLFTVALVPAVSEELVFRGILLNDLVRSTRNVHISVLVSAFIFSFIHFQFFGFFPRMLLGIVLGYLYITSGNILVSMAMHFANNAMVVIALNWYSKGALTIDPESSRDLPVTSIYLSVILSLAIMYFCWTLYKQRTNAVQKNV
ncbi:MAG TPA: CPBP family intramembrane glutamic endopeptidase [Cytophagaceae bacterium]|jgi:membrane protease YdiL (CAAX protease family)|nr:CPBP family intramembrane glutamic endopeptidase [Cytophagaceae bacterium]